MRIAIDASRANNEQRTGVEEYAFRVIEQMRNEEWGMAIRGSEEPSGSRRGNGERVEFVLYTDKPLQEEFTNLPENWTQKVLKWPPKHLWTQIRLSWEMFRNPPDVLFIPAHVMPLIHPKKTVVMIHDIAATRFPKSYNWFERWYSVWSARFALKYAWKVIVPSEFVKRELVQARENESTRAPENVTVIHHGYNEVYGKVRASEEEIERKLKKYNITRPYIMTVGRLEEKKNTVRLIEAFEKIKNKDQGSGVEHLKLVLIGKPGFGYEAVEQAITESQFKNDIIAPGFVLEEDLPYLIHAAEVFVFPSLYEGFGLPILEAFACGTPVVASQGSSLEEVGSGACIYVDPLCVEDISRGIMDVLGDKERGMRNAEKGLNRVRAFSWEKCARETKKLLLS